MPKESSEFDPSDSQYEQVSDLPQEQQSDYVDLPGGGFVRKEAGNPMLDAEIREQIGTEADAVKNHLAELEGGARDLLKKFKNFPSAFADISPELKNDRAFTLEAAKQNEGILLYASPEFLDDKDFMLDVLKNMKIPDHIWGFLGASPRRDKAFLLEAAKLGAAECLNVAPEELLRDRIFLLEIAKVNPEAIQLVQDKEIRKQLNLGPLPWE